MIFMTSLLVVAVDLFNLNIFYFIIRNGNGQKFYNIMIALSLLVCCLYKEVYLQFF